MTVRANTTMAKIVSDNDLHFTDQTMDLPLALQTFIDNGFRQEEDCVSFKDYVYFGPRQLLTDFEKSSFECFLNETDLYAYVPETATGLEILKTGIEFGKKLYEMLKITFKTNFRVIISIEKMTSDNQGVDDLGHCTINFHKIRQVSDDKFRLDNLESMTNEAIMIFE